MLRVMGEDHQMTEWRERRGVAVGDRTAIRGYAGLDGLRLVRVPLVPEIRLHLAEDAILLWARMEAEAGTTLPAPYWASAWLGGQALARYVLDHPAVVAGRRVLDLASGSGVVAIAARLAGAAAVTANDIDPYAIAAIEVNARANAADISVSGENLLAGAGNVDAEVVLAGDLFYSGSMAEAVMPFLDRASEGGAQVLVGDPGRADLPRGRLKLVASYGAAGVAAFADADIEQVHVLQLP
jgi:predicted nicotinamide N-methyase